MRKSYWKFAALLLLILAGCSGRPIIDCEARSTSGLEPKEECRPKTPHQTFDGGYMRR